MAAIDQPAYLVDVERDLRDQDHVRAAGDPRMKRDPAGAPSHHLDHQDPVVALRRRVQAVDCLGRYLQRGVEAERDVGGAEIVVDRLRHADHVHAFLVELVGDAEGVLAADRDQPVDVELGEGLADALHAVVPLVRVGPRAAEDRAAARQDPARRLYVEIDIRALEHAAPSVAEADELVAELVDPAANHRADDGVEAGTVTTAGKHADPHDASDPEQANDRDQQDLRAEHAERSERASDRHGSGRRRPGGCRICVGSCPRPWRSLLPGIVGPRSRPRHPHFSTEISGRNRPRRDGPGSVFGAATGGNHGSDRVTK